MYLSLYCKGSKRVTQGITVRGSWRPNRTAIYWPQHSIGGPEGAFDPVWLSLPHLVSDVSDPQRIRGSKGPLRRAFSTASYQQLLWTPTVLLPVFTELYNSSMPTQSPTQPLEWHVWSSSSRNNCHAVHRSLSSGASVYECTMGFFTLSHFINQIRPHDLFRLLAIGMCHFLLAHHFGLACLAGSKVEIQHYHSYFKYR